MKWNQLITTKPRVAHLAIFKLIIHVNSSELECCTLLNPILVIEILYLQVLQIVPIHSTGTTGEKEENPIYDGK